MQQKEVFPACFAFFYSHLFLIKSYIWNFTPSRYPVSRSGNNPGRVKRVVSCKRKTHHLTVARRKQLGSGRTCDAPNKENETKVLQGTQQDIFSMDPWDFPFHVNNINNNQGTDRAGCEEADYCVLTEVSKTFALFYELLFLQTRSWNYLKLTMFSSSRGITTRWLTCFLEEI